MASTRYMLVVSRDNIAMVLIDEEFKTYDDDSILERDLDYEVAREMALGLNAMFVVMES